MFKWKGEDAGIIFMAINASFSEPQYAITEVAMDPDKSPLQPEERREFVEENRTVLESLCMELHAHWKEDHPVQLTTTIH